MKVSISIPDDVFADAERLAKRLKKSRSHLYSKALREFVARHSEERVTEMLNEVLRSIGEDRDDVARVSGRRPVGRVDW